ncbi:MAG: hypothetical protein EP335_18220 [Alphaproteobacteria bacterium]|nr:MAG: hypothetical protein EP335_18220 [Alphaproteobacteria bacterium]
MLSMIEGKRIFVPVSLLLAAAVYSAIASAGGYVPALPALMVPTADIAFLFFWFAFIASATARLAPSPGTRFLIRNRRYIGLSFALIHFTHLVLVLSNLAFTGASRPLITLLGGALAYLFIGLMALTSNTASVRRLGAKRWKQLHKTGMYYVWFIFLFTSLKDPLGRGWIIGLCLFGLSLRILAHRQGQRKKAGV